jgi:hypothetical protein
MSEKTNSEKLFTPLESPQKSDAERLAKKVKKK